MGPGAMLRDRALHMRAACASAKVRARAGVACALGCRAIEALRTCRFSLSIKILGELPAAVHALALALLGLAQHVQASFGLAQVLGELLELLQEFGREPHFRELVALLPL